MLNETAIQTGVGDAWTVRVVDDVESTNDALKSRPVGSIPEALFAEYQSAGRGRRANAWLAPRGKDILMSVALRPPADFCQWARATTLAAVAVCESIEAETPLQPSIKWPNDVFIGNRKVAGLLAETCSFGEKSQLVLGIGLNVNSESFPGGVGATATSLRMELGSRAARPLDREGMAIRLLHRLQVRLGEIDDGFESALREARIRSWLFGKQVRARVRDAWVHGRGIDLDREGGLILELADGSRTTLISADEVRLTGQGG